MALARGTQLGPYELVEPIGLGGMGEVWRATDTRLKRDVAKLFYRRGGDGAMMVVDIATSPALEIGEPRVAFENRNHLPLVTPLAGGPAGRYWDVAPDGRFLMIKIDTARETREFVVVLNWFEELDRLVPVD